VKYYLPAAFWGCMAVSVLQVVWSDTLKKQGVVAARLFWWIGSISFLLWNIQDLRADVKECYKRAYGDRSAIPVLSRDIAQSAVSCSNSVHGVGVMGFEEGILPIQRRINRFYHINIADVEQNVPVHHVRASERNYMRVYRGGPRVRVALRTKVSEALGDENVYVFVDSGNAGALQELLENGYQLVNQWECGPRKVKRKVKILRYSR